MGNKKEDKKCPKCGNLDESEIDESFSHLVDVFYFEYTCRLCGVFWRRTFNYVGLEVRKDANWKECSHCSHHTTPKGNQCSTMTRRLQELVKDKSLPFIPSNVLPALETIVKECKRYEHA